MKDQKKPSKPYEAIEEAIDLSRDPSKTWDDLLRKEDVDSHNNPNEVGNAGEKVAAKQLKGCRLSYFV